MPDIPRPHLPVGTLRAAGHPDLEPLQLATDTQDIEAAMQHAPTGRLAPIGTVTGVLEIAHDADTLEIWVTGSSRPFDIAASYQRVL